MWWPSSVKTGVLHLGLGRPARRVQTPAHAGLPRRPRVLIRLIQGIPRLLDACHRAELLHVGSDLGDGHQVRVAGHVDRFDGGAQPFGVPHLEGHRPHRHGDWESVDQHDLLRVDELLADLESGLGPHVPLRNDRHRAVPRAVEGPVEPRAALPRESRPAGDGFVLLQHGSGLDGSLLRSWHDMRGDDQSAPGRTPSRPARLTTGGAVDPSRIDPDRADQARATLVEGMWGEHEGSVSRSGRAYRSSTGQFSVAV